MQRARRRDGRELRSKDGRSDRTCRLERWRSEGVATGTRALDALRDGVEAAIAVLGSGFLSAPANSALRERLRSGNLSTLDFYRQLLRLVYRLIFCFAAEDRGLLHDTSASQIATDRYALYYSTKALREVAGRRRGGSHPDMWHALLVVFTGLAAGEAGLGLPALGSFLFSARSCPDLDCAEISNSDLLEALRHLAYTQAGSVRTVVDFRNLGVEELGSIYESLLELHPRLDASAAQFELASAAGHERKTTGSYYTPASLVSALLDTALDPVLDEAASESDPEAAILGIRVLDPACGSGHFLIAAAHRIGKKLAGIRTGEEEPAPEAVRHGLRDVIGHCIYGIDVNPMAVELCKVSLWMEAIEPGRPLSFLDHRIVCGNALLGATPALVEAGIPDAAFKALTGDVSQTVSALKRDNQQQRGTQGPQGLFALESPSDPYAPLGQAIEQIDALPDDTLADVSDKEKRYSEFVESLAAAQTRLVANAWCAAFVIEKVPGTSDHPEPRITQGVLELLKSDLESAPRSTVATIEKLSREYGFLHWHLAFPGIFHVVDGDSARNSGTGWSGGFDVMLGNPPWEKVKLAEKEFFGARAPEIANAAGARRRAKIAALETDDPALFAEYRSALRHADGLSHLLRDSGRYPLCGRGDVNTYSVFAEAMRDAISPNGRMGMVVPTGIATDDTTKEFFGDIVEKRSLASLYDFENREGLFPGVHRSYKFSLLTLTGSERHVDHAEFAFFCHQAGDLDDADRRFTLSPDDLVLLNPNTRTCPVFRSRRDAEITKGIYERVPVLIRDGDPEGNPWGVQFRRLFDMTNDSGLFRSRSELESAGYELDGNVFRKGQDACLPLYEAKMVSFFDHRAADVVISATATARQRQPEYLSVNAHEDPHRLAMPNSWVAKSKVDERLEDWPHEWLLGFANVTSATNERTMIPGVIPRAAVGHSYQLILPSVSASRIALLGADLTSFALDFAARQKVGGVNLSYFLVEQFPVLPPDTYDDPAPWDPGVAVADWLSARILELTYTAWDLAGFAVDLGYDGPPFRWDEERRSLLRAEVDACFFHLYGIERDDVEYIMGTFPIVARHDIEAHGEYRTKHLVLEAYDAMEKAIASGATYETSLDPPPGDPRAAHLPRGDECHGE